MLADQRNNTRGTVIVHSQIKLFKLRFGIKQC